VFQTAREEIVNGDQVTRYEDLPASVAGSGSTTVATKGPGLYHVEVSFRLNASVTGNINDSGQRSASIRVTAAP
jgi:hypothetical protein